MVHMRMYENYKFFFFFWSGGGGGDKEKIRFN